VVAVAGDVPLLVVDGNGAVVEWSYQAEELAGCTAEQAVGQPVAHLVARVASGVRGIARTGCTEVLVPGADGQAIGDLRLRPVPRPDGSVAWAVFQAAREGATTPEAQAAAAQVWSKVEKAYARLGNQSRAQISQTLDVVTNCQAVADALVPGFADVAVVEVVDSVIRGEVPPLAPLGPEVPLRRAGFSYSGGEAQIQAHPLGDGRELPFPGPYAQVLTDLQPRVIDLRLDDPWVSADPERAAAIRRSGVRTLLAIPLALRGALLGLLSLYRTEQAGSFDEQEVSFALGMADRVALSIDNARLYTREHTIAATVESHLLPALPVSQTCTESATAHVPGEAGGRAWCDVFSVASARTALVGGEVSGHGIQAAATVGELRTVVRSLARLDLEPDELLARLNDTALLLAAERAALWPSEPSRREPLTASCVYAIYDPLPQTCTYARAHHPAPVIVSPDGIPVQVPDVPPGPLLGTTDGLPFTATTVKVEVGSILAFYTSSFLLTAPPGGPDDLGPLQRSLADTQRPLQDLCDQVVHSLREGFRPGDAALHLARTRTFPPGQVGTWQFSPGPEAAAWTRAQVRRKLADWSIDEDTAYDIELIVSELVANAIRYGEPPMWLRIIKDLTISCEVHDGSPVTPYLRHPGTLDEFGRGLLIVGRLVETWGTRRTPDGKIVWAEVALPQHSESR